MAVWADKNNANRKEGKADRQDGWTVMQHSDGFFLSQKHRIQPKSSVTGSRSVKQTGFFGTWLFIRKRCIWIIGWTLPSFWGQPLYLHIAPKSFYLLIILLKSYSPCTSLLSARSKCSQVPWYKHTFLSQELQHCEIFLEGPWRNLVLAKPLLCYGTDTPSVLHRRSHWEYFKN